MNPFLHVLALGVHAPNALVTMYNATEAARDRMPEVFEVRLERAPGYVCNSSDTLVVYY